MLGHSLYSLQQDELNCDSDFAPAEENDEELGYDEKDDFIAVDMAFGGLILRVDLEGYR